MIFYLKLFREAVKVKKKYLYLAFLVVLAYLFLAALFPHHYHITQEIKARDNILLSPGLNPMDMTTVQSVLYNPDSFFTDNHALMDLREHLLTGDSVPRPKWADWLPSRFAVFIKRAVIQDLTLRYDEEGRLALSYHGTDRDLGMALVNFYSSRLLWAGKRAHERTVFSPGIDPGELILADVVPGIVLEGDLSISTSRALLTRDRLTSAFWFLLTLVLLALTFAWISQYARPKLYSERQTSRYLETKVLGSIPNLDRLDCL
jgi:hypothetical protein